MNISTLSFNWFDLAVLGVLTVGMVRGRRRGMSEELLDVLKWLVIVIVGGMVYRPVGIFVAGYIHVSPTTAYVLVYLAVIIVGRFLFGWVKHSAGEKLVGSDVFGRGEYYFGMAAGAVRFTCYLVAALAILNAKNISAEQLAAQARSQQDNFGDISFPTIGSLQQTIFVGSASGQFAKKYLTGQLIVPTAADRTATPAETIGRQRERAVYEVLGEKR